MDLRDVTLLGWSLGGQVVLERYPAIRSRVSRLILVGTTPRFTAATDWSQGLEPIQVRAMTRDLKRNYLSTMENFFNSQFAEEEISRERHRRVIDFAVRGGCLPAPEVALAALATLQSADLRGRMATTDCPVFLLHGEQDRITLPGASRFMVEHLPRARLSLLGQTGHVPFLSRPEECFRLWREFLP
jgi:pimeloyl-[acyl-carrier protein] methyl ester esterase